MVIYIYIYTLYISLHANILMKGMNPFLLTPQNGLFSLSKVTGLVEGKTLNPKPEECCLRESVALLCTILLLSTYPKSVADSTQTYKKIPV